MIEINYRGYRQLMRVKINTGNRFIYEFDSQPKEYIKEVTTAAQEKA